MCGADPLGPQGGGELLARGGYRLADATNHTHNYCYENVMDQLKRSINLPYFMFVIPFVFNKKSN